MEKTCLKCKGTLTLKDDKYVCSCCDSVYVLEGEQLVDCTPTEEVMTEANTYSNIEKVLKICEDNLNNNVKNVKKFYKDLLAAMKKYPIDENDLSLIVNLIVSKVDLDFLPTHGSAYKSFLKSQDKKRRIERLKKQFSLELERALASLLEEYNKYDKKLYSENGYKKITSSYNKHKSEMLDLSYLTEKYQAEFRNIIAEYKKSVKKVKTLAQIKKAKKKATIFAITAASLTATIVTIGFIPTLEYRQVNANTYEVIGVKGTIFDKHFAKKKIKIPAKHNGGAVVSIASGAFAKSEIKSVTIPNTVKKIGASAFADNKLESVSIPSSVTQIGEGAFKNNASLKTVDFKGEIRILEDDLFANCIGLTEVKMAGSPVNIETSAFYYCRNLTTIPSLDSVEKIGEYAFSNCTSLESISLTENVKEVAKNAFAETPNLAITYDGSGYDWSKISGVKDNLEFKEYTIEYQENKGDAFFKKETLTMKSSFTLPSKEVTGYIFKGYYTGINGTGVQATADTGKALVEFVNNKELLNKPEAIKLYPYYDPITYKVEFESNGGSNVNPLEYNIEDEFTLSKPTRTGYTFKGWCLKSDLSDTPITELKESTGNLKLYAKWEANKYNIYVGDPVTVTFDYRYSGLTNKVVDIEDGKILEYPTEPTRNGYLFKGWYTDSSYTTKYNFTGTIRESMTLYAKWESFSSSYEKASQITESNPNSWTIDHDSSEYERVVIDKDGTYYFNYKITRNDSYSYDSDYYYRVYIEVYNETRSLYINSGSYYYPSTDYSSFSSFTASAGDVIRIKTKCYWNTSRLDYYFNLSSGSTITSTAVGEVEQIEVTYNQPFAMTPAEAQTGYAFVGYYTEENGQGTKLTDETGASIGNYAFASNISVYPHFEIANYAINYHNVDDITSTFERTTFTFEDEFELEEPTRPGYEFDGWYYDSNYSSSITTISNRTEELDAYAKWTPKTYVISMGEPVKVTFDYCTDGIEDKEVTVISSQYLQYPVDVEREGYYLAGWYTDSSYTNKYNFTGQITESMTLYAKWISSSSTYEKTSEVTSSNVNSKYVSNGSSYAQTYADRIVVDKTGTYYFYYKNGYSSSSYRIYLSVYNETQGTTIRSDSYISNTSYSSVSFTANAGDVIRIQTYYYSYNSYLYYYFSLSRAGLSSTAYSNVSGKTVTYGNDFNLSVPTAPTGKIFAGYYTEEDGEGTRITDTSGYGLTAYNIPNDISAYPYYIDGYRINYYNMSDITNPNQDYIEVGETLTLVSPTREGYTFGGWYTNSSFTGDPVTSLSDVTSTVSLYAKWTANTYTLTLVNGENSSTTKEVTYGQSFSVSSLTLPSGYQFLGYYTEEDGEGTKIIDSSYSSVSSWNIAEDTTLYAYIREIPYTISTTTSSYPFASTNNGQTYVSGNGGYHNTNSTLRIDFNVSGTFSFYYSVSSEQTHDKMTVYINGSSQTTKSGSASGTLTYNVNAGDYITITYSKDGSVNSSPDRVQISSITFTRN